MKTYLASFVFVVGACADSIEPSDVELAADDAVLDGKSDGPSDWNVTRTLHVGVRAFDTAASGGRSVHPLWLAGTPAAPLPLHVEVVAAEGYDVRVAVLGPLRNGKREVIGADGYASRKSTARVQRSVKTSGEHLLVIGSYNLERETFYDVVARCTNCAPARTDTLASPKVGALVAMGTDRLLQTKLGNVLANRTFDVELELWASPPGQWWNAQHVATSVASGTQVNALVPDTVTAGDDLRLVVRRAGGPVLDSGAIVRFAPDAVAFARTDAILYGDLVSLQIGGVVGFFEGAADMVLKSEQTGNEIARHTIHAELPGAVGNGFGAFDATFAPELFDENGTLNPNLPHNGEVLSIGWLDGNGGYRRLGCFEYCNDLSGMETCTGGPRACP